MTVTTEGRRALRKVTMGEVREHFLSGKAMENEVEAARKVLKSAKKKQDHWTVELFDLALRKLADARRVKVKKDAFVLLPGVRVSWAGSCGLTWELKLKLTPALAKRICLVKRGEMPKYELSGQTEVFAMLDEVDFADALEKPRYAGVYQEPEARDFTMADRGVNTPFLYAFRNEDKPELNGKFGVLILARQSNGSVIDSLWIKDSWKEALALGVELSQQAKLKRADPLNFYWKLPERTGMWVQSWEIVNRLGYRL